MCNLRYQFSSELNRLKKYKSLAPLDILIAAHANAVGTIQF